MMMRNNWLRMFPFYHNFPAVVYYQCESRVEQKRNKSGSIISASALFWSGYGFLFPAGRPALISAAGALGINLILAFLTAIWDIVYGPRGFLNRLRRAFAVRIFLSAGKGRDWKILAKVLKTGSSCGILFTAKGELILRKKLAFAHLNNQKERIVSQYDARRSKFL